MNGRDYFFRVSAVNEAGRGPSSETGLVRPRSTPAAPPGVTGTSGDRQVNLAWKAPADNGAAITDYVIEYRRSTDTVWLRFSDTVSATPAVAVTGLVNGQSYVFRVTAVNEMGAGTPSNASAAVTPMTVPGGPRDVSAVGTSDRGRARLSWQAPIDDGGTPITGYTIEWIPNVGGSWAFSESTTVPAGTTSRTIAGLVDGLSYQFRVRATNAMGAGSAVMAANPATVWRHAGLPVRAGGTGADTATSAVAVGNATIVTGSFSGAARFGDVTLTSAGLTDVYVAKLNADGSAAWAVRAGGTGADGGVRITSLPDGSTILLGSFTNEATFGTMTISGSGNSFVAKLNPQGQFVWARAVDGNVAGVSALADGSVILTGSFSGTASFGGTSLTAVGSNDGFVAKLNVAGAFVWVARAGGVVAEPPPPTQPYDPYDPYNPYPYDPYNPYPYDPGYGSGPGYTNPTTPGRLTPSAVAVASDGSSYITGTFSGEVAFGDTTLGAGSGSSMSASPDANERVFVAKLNANGSFAWAQALSAAAELYPGSSPIIDVATDIAVLANGNVLVAGECSGTFAGIPPREPDPLLMSGITWIGGASPADGFLVALSPTGSMVSAERLGSPVFPDRVIAITPQADGSVLMIAHFSVERRVYGNMLTSDAEVSITKMDATAPWSARLGWSNVTDVVGLANGSAVVVQLFHLREVRSVGARDRGRV